MEHPEPTVAVCQGASLCPGPADILQGPAGEALWHCSLLLPQLETGGACLGAVLMLAEQTSARVILNPAPAQPLSQRELATRHAGAVERIYFSILQQTAKNK